MKLVSFNRICFTLILCVSSCSKSNDFTEDTFLTGDYLPSNVNSNWNYNVINTSTTNTNLNFNRTDFLKIKTNTSNTFTLDVNNGAVPNGSMNVLLSNGTLSKTEATLRFSGNLSLPTPFNELLDTEIGITNMTMYDLNATNTSELFSLEQVLNRDIDFQGTKLPSEISYNLKTVKTDYLQTLTVDGVAYNNIIKCKLSLNLGVKITISVAGNPIQQNLINPQDVLNIDYYFAEDTGLIKAEAQQGFQLNPDIVTLLNLAGIDLSEFSNVSITNTQELDSFFIAQ